MKAPLSGDDEAGENSEDFTLSLTKQAFSWPGVSLHILKRKAVTWGLLKCGLGGWSDQSTTKIQQRY